MTKLHVNTKNILINYFKIITKIKNTNSIKINMKEKELYHYRGEENNTFINNIKLDIIECFENTNKFKNINNNTKKIQKAKKKLIKSGKLR